MFYLACLMFLHAGHNGFLAVIEAVLGMLHDDEEAHVE
jgi:hypothetical protein